jgi:putative chitinase
MIDRDIYFDAVRETMFAGAMSQEQVDGQNAILALWDWQATGSPMTDLRWLAYMLATVFHECATRMWPIEEYGKGQGQPYGEPDENGNCFYGRGFVQLTWKENYEHATKALSLTGDRDLGLHPERALDVLIAARIMFRGMSEGWFRDSKLGDFFNKEENDPVGARDIINGDVGKNGELVAGYHDAFLAALQEAETEAPGPTPDVQTLTYKLTITAPVGDVSIEVEQQT